MRKLLFVLSFMLFTSQLSFAQNENGQEIILTLQIDDNHSSSNGSPKTSIIPPEVSIYGHTLYFTGTHVEFVLTLTDEEDNVVFTTVVYDTDTQIVLPSSLSGAYELRLYTDIYCFVGEITL